MSHMTRALAPKRFVKGVPTCWLPQYRMVMFLSFETIILIYFDYVRYDVLRKNVYFSLLAQNCSFLAAALCNKNQER